MIQAMSTFRIFCCLCLALSPTTFAKEIQISALHPLMADLARQVGGERIGVFDLVGEGGDPHRFEPKPADLRSMQASDIILAAGKGMESYLDRIKGSLPEVRIFEVGESIPSRIAAGACCPHDHDHGHNHAVDPHWWQSIDHMRRAATVLADLFSELDPAGKAIYRQNANTYAGQLSELKSWTRRELARVPRNQRKLVTAHNAFAYFADEFGFEVIAVAGLNKEQDHSPKELSRIIESIQTSGVPAIFPERGDHEKTLKAMARSTGTTLATPLIADGNGIGNEAGFIPMIRHNVASITAALVPAEQPVRE